MNTSSSTFADAKSPKWFLATAVTILAATALAKAIGASGDVRILSHPDPLLGLLTNRQTMLLAIVLEVGIIGLVLRERAIVRKAAFIAWIGTVFLAYRVGLWSIGYKGSCGCLGNVTDTLGISPATADLVSGAMLGYLLIGSYAILAVLAGLLLPVLQRGQAKAQGINCLNNLRQMQIAWQMYTDDHAGWVPENQAELYRGIWRGTPNSWTGPSSAPFDTDTFAIEYGSLYRGGYARSLPLFRCPSDDARVRKPEGGELDLDRTRSYAMNGNFGGREQETQQVFRREQVVFNPSAVFVFIDEDERSIDDGHFLVWPAPDDRWVNMPADRHRRGATLSFADGHVELWRWEWRKRFAMRVLYWFPAEDEADLRDLRRLQAAVVEPERVKR